MPGDLLCDADRAVAMRYGAAESAAQEKAARVSMLIDADGRIRRVYGSVDPAQHVANVLEDDDDAS